MSVKIRVHTEGVGRTGQDCCALTGRDASSKVKVMTEAADDALEDMWPSGSTSTAVQSPVDGQTGNAAMKAPTFEKMVGPITIQRWNPTTKTISKTRSRGRLPIVCAIGTSTWDTIES